MNIAAKTLYKTGSVSMMLIGTGHTALHFAVKGKDPASAHIFKQMKDFKLNIIGFGSRSLLEFHEGFSITMGVLLFFIGLQNFFLSGSLKSASHTNKGIILVPALLAGITFILTLKYFIILPQALSLIAFLAYSLSLWKLRRDKSCADVGNVKRNTTGRNAKAEV